MVARSFFGAREYRRENRRHRIDDEIVFDEKQERRRKPQNDRTENRKRRTVRNFPEKERRKLQNHQTEKERRKRRLQFLQRRIKESRSLELNSFFF